MRLVDSYAIPQSGFVVALHASLDKTARQRYMQASRICSPSAAEKRFRRAQRLLHAGKQQAAIDVLVAFATQSQSLTDNNPAEFINLVRSLPEDWLGHISSWSNRCEDLAASRAA